MICSFVLRRSGVPDPRYPFILLSLYPSISGRVAKPASSSSSVGI